VFVFCPRGADSRLMAGCRVGKHGRVGTAPIPTGAAVPIDAWSGPAMMTEGHVFRSVNRGDTVPGPGLSENVVWQMLRPYAAAAGVPGIAPHDCRRTAAKLCRAAGGELEQIQLPLGHASVQTTERYRAERRDQAEGGRLPLGSAPKKRSFRGSMRH
jgi:integrase